MGRSGICRRGRGSDEPQSRAAHERAGPLRLQEGDADRRLAGRRIRPLAEEVALLFSRQANKKGVEVSCAVHNAVPDVIGGYTTRLRQIISNLMGNAIKCTERGEVVLGIQVRRPRARGDGAPPVLQILVHDTGIGMSEAAQRNLFSAFTQAEFPSSP
jgi:signal transduction histidine kinase